MKIYFITRSYLPDITGGTLIRKAQVDFLKKEGFNVVIVTPNYNNNKNITTQETIQIPFNQSIKWNLIKERIGLKEDYLDEWVKSTFNYMKDIVNPEDVLFCTSGGELACIKLGILLKEYNNAKVVVNLHDPIDGATVNGYNYTFYLKKRNKFEKKYLNKADNIVVTSEVNRESLIAKGIDSRKVILSYFGYIEKKPSIQRENKFVFGYGGNFSALQKPSMLIEALGKFKKECECFFIGDTSKDEILKNTNYNWIHKLSAMSHDEYLNFFSNNIDIGFISLSNDYLGACVPSKLYEYINLEKPIFAIIPYGDAYDIINNKEYGVACYYKDENEIQVGLEKILDQEFYSECKSNIIRDKNEWNISIRLEKLIRDLNI